MFRWFKDRLHAFLVKNKGSLWLVFLAWLMTAMMMWPTMVGVLLLAINLGVLFLIRSVSHLEGREAEKSQKE